MNSACSSNPLDPSSQDATMTLSPKGGSSPRPESADAMSPNGTVSSRSVKMKEDDILLRDSSIHPVDIGDSAKNKIESDFNNFAVSSSQSYSSFTPPMAIEIGTEDGLFAVSVNGTSGYSKKANHSISNSISGIYHDEDLLDEVVSTSSCRNSAPPEGRSHPGSSNKIINSSHVTESRSGTEIPRFHPNKNGQINMLERWLAYAMTQQPPLQSTLDGTGVNPTSNLNNTTTHVPLMQRQQQYPQSHTSSRMEVFYAMAVAASVAIFAVTYSAAITFASNSSDNSNNINKASSTIPDKGEYITTDGNDANAASSNTSCTNNSNTLEMALSSLSTGFVAAIVAVSFFSKMKLTMTFDGETNNSIIKYGHYDNKTPNKSEYDLPVSADTHSGSANSPSKPTNETFTASLHRFGQYVGAACVVSATTFIMMNFSNTIFGKVCIALYVLFLGM